MSTSAKSTKTEETSSAAVSADLLNKGLERVAEVSKTWLDLASEQNAEVLASYKKTLKAWSLPVFLFDGIGTAAEGYVALQKSLLELAVEQSTAVITAVQECSQDASNAKSKINTLIQESTDRTVAAQSLVLEFSATQAKAVVEIVERQSGTLVETVQRSVDNLATKTAKNMAAKA